MKKKRILQIVAILQIAVLFSLVSFAWFAERATPSIEEASIRVASADGLLIKLTQDSPARSSISLNNVVGGFSLFELKQVSSADSSAFFYVDFGEGLSSQDPEFVQVVYNLDGSLDMQTYGYIDHIFYLQAEEFDKYIYLHKDTFITGDAVDAIRFSLAIGESVYIFGNERENGIIDPFTTKAVIEEGIFDFYDPDPLLTSNQIVYLIEDWNGGRGVSDFDPLDVDKTFGIVPAEEKVPVRLRIWLEGGDVDCTNIIASTILDVFIKFGSSDVLLAAPNVTPNNSNYTINNLTTDMEYSYELGENEDWITVTDPSVVFGTGQTVYVRIAAVPGVSPRSHPTIVTFS